MGPPYNTNPSLISFGNIKSGSVVVDGTMSVNGGSDPNQILTQASNSMSSSGGFSGFSLASGSFVANGFTAVPSSSNNLGLILGIAIPIGLAIIIIIIVIIIRTRAPNPTSTSEK